MASRRVLAAVRKAATVTAVSAGLVLAVTPPASAAQQDGTWNYGELAFWYNSAAYGYGSLSDFSTPVSDLGSPIAYEFLSGGAGHGVKVKNHAAAAGNAPTDGVSARVYYNSGYDCTVACQKFAADQTQHDLKSTLKNNNASWKWI